jgi:hypothetical protein
VCLACAANLLTIPELLLILESVRDFKFHTTAAFMSTSEWCRGRLALFHRGNNSCGTGMQPFADTKWKHGIDSRSAVAGDVPSRLPRDSKVGSDHPPRPTSKISGGFFQRQGVSSHSRVYLRCYTTWTITKYIKEQSLCFERGYCRYVRCLPFSLRLPHKQLSRGAMQSSIIDVERSRFANPTRHPTLHLRYAMLYCIQ